MRAKPETNSTQVPGSGSTPGAPQGPPFFLTSPSPTQQPVSTVPFFLTGPHRPTGNGGGAMGTQLPPTNGLYRLSGPAGPSPGACSRSRVLLGIDAVNDGGQRGEL